jgi:hypothetical protein
MYSHIIKEHTRLQNEKLQHGIEAIKPSVEALIKTIENAIEAETISSSDMIVISRISAAWNVELAISANRNEHVVDIESIPASSVLSQLTFSHWWKIVGALAVIVSGAYYLASLATSYEVKTRDLELQAAKVKLDNEVSKVKLLEKSIQIKSDEVTGLSSNLDKCNDRVDEKQKKLDSCLAENIKRITKP